VTTPARALVDRLTAAGVRACLDERDINPPCVFVPEPIRTGRFGAGGANLEFTAWAVTTNAGRNVDNQNLHDLLQAVGDALAWAVVRAEPADLLIPSLSAPLPAYRMTWTDRLTPLETTVKEKHA
jgi:hypothetical protein